MVGSAFLQSKYPFPITSVDAQKVAEGASKIVRLKQAASVRQSVNWGLRACQGSFSHMKDRIFYKERVERKLMLLCSVPLFNLRARAIGVKGVTF